jgi:putative hemolysin
LSVEAAGRKDTRPERALRYNHFFSGKTASVPCRADQTLRMSIFQHSLILLVLVFFSAFFSGIETAFVSLSDIRVQHLIDQGKKGMSLVKLLKDNNQRLIITILVGNNLVNIAASAFATSLAMDMFASNAIGIAVGAMTFIILIFGEITPKTIAMAKNEWIAVHTAPAIRICQYVFYPVILLLQWIMTTISRPMEMNLTEPIITEAEIKSVVSLGETIGEVEEDERIMIHNIFRFSDLEACEIMVDRTQIFFLNAEEKVKNAAEEIVQKGFSRIPVYEENYDHVIGILYAKDVLQATIRGDLDATVKYLIRPAMFIPETMLIDDLLREFQKEKVHLALVVDEHGGVSGLVTIEDLIEEIVGDIYDETDNEEVMIRKVDAKKSIVKGETEIEDVNRELNMGLSEREDYETISGFILSELRYIPEVGEELKIGNNTIRITKADKQRIIEVEIEKRPPDKSDAVQPDPAGA